MASTNTTEPNSAHSKAGTRPESRRERFAIQPKTPAPISQLSPHFSGKGQLVDCGGNSRKYDRPMTAKAMIDSAALINNMLARDFVLQIDEEEVGAEPAMRKGRIIVIISAVKYDVTGAV